VAPVKNTTPATTNSSTKNEPLPAAEPETSEPVTETKGRSLDDKMNALFTQGSNTSEKDKTKTKNPKK
jgi:hypothetical protein